MPATKTTSPAPWYVIPGNNNGDAARGPCIQCHVDDTGEGDYIVADVHEGETAEADANLIAAAPALLAACELWDQGFVDGEEFDEKQFLAWVNKNRAAARAAVRKAKGEPS